MSEPSLGRQLLIVGALVQGLWTRVRPGSRTSCKIFHEVAMRTPVPSMFQCFHLAWDTDIGSVRLQTLALLLTQFPGPEPSL